MEENKYFSRMSSKGQITLIKPILMDLIINDYKVGNETLVKIYQKKVSGTDNKEKETLNASPRHILLCLK